jgi:16S rRNA (guanine966-N2)-methyltransferase
VSDRAREGLFSSLGGRVPGAVCLDLFAGTGAMGIEALSRGAERCDFVDSSPAAGAAIRENLARTHLEDRARVVRSDAGRFLAGAEGGYDLVFLDPPYALPDPDLADVLDPLQPHLLTGATIVVTRPAQSGTDVIPVNLQVVRRLTYGDARILVLEGL